MPQGCKRQKAQEGFACIPSTARRTSICQFKTLFSANACVHSCVPSRLAVNAQFTNRQIEVWRDANVAF
ncbi:hypothetical protein CAI21_10430 [Alkalilimnicola ehrlichii]|nr:hypothetical protein CAI21_10430 [Alkalilimnicola ehrlichii]